MKFNLNRETGGKLLELGEKARQIPGLESPPQTTKSPRFKIKNILVPIDFSSCSKQAVHYAAALAEQSGARLSLLHVWHSGWLVPELAPLDINGLGVCARAEAAAKLLELATEEISDQVPADFLVRNGHPPLEIIAAARDISADLIVIATHGYTGLKHFWHGSMTESVVRQAPCPVLVVREEEHEFLS